MLKQIYFRVLFSWSNIYKNSENCSKGILFFVPHFDNHSLPFLSFSFPSVELKLCSIKYNFSVHISTYIRKNAQGECLNYFTKNKQEIKIASLIIPVFQLIGVPCIANCLSKMKIVEIHF